MGPKNTRNLEKKILECTERLIECAITTSLLSDESKERELKRGTDLVCEIAANLKELIDVKDAYLPEILGQLVSQKLPDVEIQTSLGTFGQELEHILKLGATALAQRPPDNFQPRALEEPLETSYGAVLLPPEYQIEAETQAVFAPLSSTVKAQPVRGLELSLQLLFPGEQILKAALLDGVEFDFYLPGRTLVCDNELTKGERESKEKICSSKGLYYVAIDAEDSKNPRRVQRILKRAGTMNAGS